MSGNVDSIYLAQTGSHPKVLAYEEVPTSHHQMVGSLDDLACQEAKRRQPSPGRFMCTMLYAHPLDGRSVEDPVGKGQKVELAYWSIEGDELSV